MTADKVNEMQECIQYNEEYITNVENKIDQTTSYTKVEIDNKLNDCVKTTDYATRDTPGLVAIRSENGVYVNSKGVVVTVAATADEIAARNSIYHVITPSNINTAVKATLTDNKHISDLTDSEKQNARNVIGAISLNDVPKGDKGDPGESGEQGKSAYQSYVDTTSDESILSEIDWVHSLSAGEPKYVIDKSEMTDKNKMYVYKDGQLYAYFTKIVSSDPVTKTETTDMRNSIYISSAKNRIKSDGTETYSGTSFVIKISLKDLINNGDYINVTGFNRSTTYTLGSYGLYYNDTFSDLAYFNDTPSSSGDEKTITNILSHGVAIDYKIMSDSSFNLKITATDITDIKSATTFEFGLTVADNGLDNLSGVGSVIRYNTITSGGGEIGVTDWNDTGITYVAGDYKSKISSIETVNKEQNTRLTALENNSYATTIPEYWKTTIDGLKNSINEKQNISGIDSVQFVWMSDPHIYRESQDSYNSKVKYIGKLTQYTCDQYDIPFVVCTGDLASQVSHSSEDGRLLDYVKVKEYLYPIKNAIMLEGNHDAVFGYNNSVNPALYDYNEFSDTKMFNTIFRHFSNQDYNFGDTGLYFYIDYTPHKIRYIALDSDFTEPNNTERTIARSGIHSYGEDQIKWLANIALKDVPNGYSVVILTHVPPIVSASESNPDVEVFKGIINAFKNKTTYTGSSTLGIDGWNNYSISVDFTKYNGDLICIFAGHQHQDLIDTISCSVPIIVITNAGGNPRDGLTRTEGTSTETAFDIVTIDKKNKKIYMTRCGVGEDRNIYYN